MIKKAKKKDSKVLAKMAMKIWEENNLYDLVKEFEEFAQDPNMASFY